MKWRSYITDCSTCIDHGFTRGAVVFSLIAVDLALLEFDLEIVADAVLSIDEQDQFSKYTFAKRQREWLGGRLACKEAVCRLMGSKDLQAITVANDEHGRPFVRGEGCQDVHVSISHSGQFAMALVCHVPCGLDLQEITPSLDRVGEKFILPEDRELISKFSGASTAKLGLVWAVKEALRKQVELWPLLGFLEIGLEQVHQCGKGFTVCCSSVLGERPLPEKLPVVFTTQFKQYALAVSFGSKKS